MRRRARQISSQDSMRNDEARMTHLRKASAWQAKDEGMTKMRTHSSFELWHYFVIRH
jgi:hypothetical protein